MARRKREKVELTGDEEQIVSFKLGKETFGVRVSQVREIGKVQNITKIPKMPDYIEGVMNLRGQITTVIDLKKRFGIDGNGSGITTASRIIVAEIGDTQIGIIVDDVLSVSTFSRKDVDTSAASVNREQNNIIGIIRKKIKVKDKDDNELIIWIDILRLLKEVDQEILKQGNGEETEAGE